MKKTTKEILDAYVLLVNAKVTKMDDADKFKVIKALRPIRKIGNDFNDFKTVVLEKLKGENHDELAKMANKWQKEKENTTLTEQEKIKVNSYFAEYNNKVTKCLKEELEKEHDLDDVNLTEEAFGQLVASNDWTLGQIEIVENILC